jgi:hypothetical protein
MGGIEMRLKKVLSLLVVMILLVSILPCQVAVADGPSPASGNHVKWIDRIADLPSYAKAFYNWLEKNAAPGGALVDPTKATERKGTYVYPVHTIEGTASFNYSSESYVGDQALKAALAHAGDAPQMVMNYIFDVFGAFDRDHPEVFWLNTETICGMGIDYEYSTTGSVRKVDYKLQIYFYLHSEDYDVRLEAYRSPAKISAAIEKRDQDVQQILAGCPMDQSVQAQVQYLNQALIRSNAYNSAADTSGADPLAWKCVSALSGSTGEEGPVCEGYARAFKVLCDRLGIPCVLTSGFAKSKPSGATEQHMWNYVRIDGQWYGVDVTWNDPTAKSNPNAAVSGYEQEKWLLLGSQTKVADGLLFKDSHTVYNRIQNNGLCYTNGPVLAQQAYGPTDDGVDVSAYRSGSVYTAPVKDGYVFAGWFTDPELSQPLGKNVKTGSAYPKFVDADVLTVKYQITSGTTANSSKTDLRLLTGIDSLNYSNVVFEVTVEDQSSQLACTAVYEKVIAGGMGKQSAAAVFGGDAKYFATYTLKDIPQKMFGTGITITPRWQTLDGTVVWGPTRTLRISNSFR